MAELADQSHRTRGVTKSPTAYRTISEVSDELSVPQHVLRFWETRFNQVRPLKRGGGRRYYRPEDVHLLRRIQKLLYEEGYTIKGVQKLLREGRVGPDDGAEGGAGAEGQRAPEPEPAELPFDAGEGEAEGPEMSDEVRAELRIVLEELRTLRALLPETED